MTAIGPPRAKAETFLIVLAALCLFGATAVFLVQYTEVMTRAAISETATNEQNEPARVPLPAGPRKFQ